MLWNVDGSLIQQHDWKVGKPIAAAFSQDGMRAAIGGGEGQIVIWDLDE